MMLDTVMTTLNLKRSKKPIPAWSKRLRARREELEYTQEEVVALAGEIFSQRAVSHLEQGTSPLTGVGLLKATAYARALKWSLEDLQKETGINLGIEKKQTMYAEIPDGRWVYAVDTASASRPRFGRLPSVHTRAKTDSINPINIH